MVEQKIVAKIIEEALGSPKEHVENSLKNLIEKIKTQHKVISYNVYEAVESQTLWSSYAELEVEFTKVEELIGYCFDYMPSSVEVISPSKLQYESRDMDMLFNDLVARLHRYDAVIRNLKAEIKLLKKEEK